jgi:hypothetical protein
MKPISTVLVSLFLGAALGAEDKAKAQTRNAREVLEGWVAAAMAGNVEEAAILADQNTSLAKKKGMEEFKAMVAGKLVRILVVQFSDKKGQAAAMSEAVKIAKPNPDGRDTWYLSFKLVRKNDKWILKDIDFDTEEKAKGKMEEFGKNNPDAKEIPAKAKEK